MDPSAAHAKTLPGAAGAEELVDLTADEPWRRPNAEIARLQLLALDERSTQLAPRVRWRSSSPPGRVWSGSTVSRMRRRCLIDLAG